MFNKPRQAEGHKCSDHNAMQPLGPGWNNVAQGHKKQNIHQKAVAAAIIWAGKDFFQTPLPKGRVFQNLWASSHLGRMLPVVDGSRQHSWSKHVVDQGTAINNGHYQPQKWVARADSPITRNHTGANDYKTNQQSQFMIHSFSLPLMNFFLHIL